MSKNRLWFLLFLLPLSFAGCDVFNPAEEYPAYINFENPVVEVDSVAGFEANYGLKDAWIYQNGDEMGAFPIPGSIIPYTNLSRTNFRFQGGVYESGLSSYRLPYPFWEILDVEIQQDVLDTFTVTPVFKYKDDTKIEFALEEDFESGFQLIGYGPTLDTARMVRSRQEAFQGVASGKVEFDADHTYWEAISTSQITPLAKDRDVWMEVTYKTEVPFTIGLRHFPFSSPLDEKIVPAITVVPKGLDEWSTIYVHLISIVRDAPTDAVYTLWFQTATDGTEGKLFIDNIRLLHED